jgi:ribosomal protein S18 acetylase RimI-like enzyme
MCEELIMKVVIAQQEDYTPWLALAAEVEDLFGPMVNNPDFQQTLLKNIGRGTAYCIRENDGSPGTSLIGGMLFSPKPPIYKISWLVVSQKYQRQGIGQMLVDYGIRQVQPPAEMVVTTFAPNTAGGEPARRFYNKLSFTPAEIVYHNYQGQSEPYQVFRRLFDDYPSKPVQPIPV